MGFHLAAADGTSLKLNAWIWGTLHQAVTVANILPDELWAPARYNGATELDAETVQTLVTFLEGTLLPALAEGERLLLDGTTTDVPDDGTFYREEGEMWKNYSLPRDVLVKVIAFLKNARPPISIG